MADATPNLTPNLTPRLFHNPSCSKSRRAKEILDEAGVEYELVQYIKEPPTKAELERIVDLIEDDPGDLVRRNDPKFKALDLDPAGYRDKGAVVALLVEHPELMERPVVVVGDRAVIGRPTERVQELLA